jgi:hypothetical protein
VIYGFSLKPSSANITPDGIGFKARPMNACHGVRERLTGKQ